MQTNSTTSDRLSPSGSINTPEVSGLDYTEPAWQTRTQWEQQRDRSDTELQAHHQAMREACEKIEVLYELEMTDDYLQQEVYGGGACDADPLRGVYAWNHI